VTAGATRFDSARAIADAVLLEGYVLYPYRSCSTKNRYRWTFGVVAPRDWSEAGGCEPSWLEAQMLVESHERATSMIRGRLRFLHVVDRRIEVADGDGYRTADRLDVDGRAFVPWEEGDLREIDFSARVGPDCEERVVPFVVPADDEHELLVDVRGRVAGRIVRSRAAVEGTIRVRTDRVDPGLSRVSVRVDNLTPSPIDTERALAMRVSCISAHVLVAVEGGAFVSLIDPPPHAVNAAQGCTSVGAYPVLAGDEGRADLMLCSPIILYDHPKIAPESPGDFFDATEIDAMLALRTRTLTPEEKVLARATDPRSAAILDRVERLDHDALTRMNGVMRDRRPVAPPSRFARGARVRLRPDRAGRRTDAQDLLYVGRTATVDSVRHDVDGREYLLVTIDDDPAAEVLRARGIFHHYDPDEVELIGGEER
jgi:hypothetical protein